MNEAAEEPSGHEHDDASTGPMAAYTGGRYAPLGGYLALTALYNVIFGAFLVVMRLMGRRFPERVGAGDIVLIGVASHKVSRLLGKDFVTSPMRAPFTKAVANAGTGELHEEARGRGLRLAIGELVTCPWCLDWWVAAFFGYGLALAPRLTRWIGAVFGAVTVADFLQLAYERAKVAAGQSPSAHGEG